LTDVFSSAAGKEVNSMGKKHKKDQDATTEVKEKPVSNE